MNLQCVRVRDRYGKSSKLCIIDIGTKQTSCSQRCITVTHAMIIKLDAEDEDDDSESVRTGR